MSTIKQIAYLAGVSRGTVDRVLNNRGAVNAETAAKVREIAEALRYSPNRLGKTLAVRKKNLKFGYILFGSTASNPFFEDVVVGIQRKAAELAEYGVTVEMHHTGLDGYQKQADLMEQLAGEGVNGIAITPVNHPLVAAKVGELKARGIPVVTVNSDIPECGRLAYVGSDYFKSGQTAAGLMDLITRGRAGVGIVIGSEQVLCHSERVAGFRQYAAERLPGIRILGTVKNNDDDLQSYAVTQELLRAHPGIDALFLASAGVQGACRAVSEMGLAGKLKIISHDTSPYTCEMLRQGVIAATLCQQPEVQGAKPLDLLLEQLGMDVPPAKERYYTNIEIKIRENL